MLTRKEKIITAAAELFRKKGYSAVTMRDIADTLNIKAASLYNHIASKQEILSELVVGTAEKFTVGMNRIKNENIRVPEKIKKIIEQHIELTVENPGAMAVLNNDWMHLEEQLNYFLTMRQDYEHNFRQILKAGMQTGEITRKNADIVLFSLLSTLRNLYGWYTKKKDIDVFTLRNELPELLLRGILFEKKEKQ